MIVNQLFPTATLLVRCQSASTAACWSCTCHQSHHHDMAALISPAVAERTGSKATGGLSPSNLLPQSLRDLRASCDRSTNIRSAHEKTVRVIKWHWERIQDLLIFILCCGCMEMYMIKNNANHTTTRYQQWYSDTELLSGLAANTAKQWKSPGLRSSHRATTPRSSWYSLADRRVLDRKPPCHPRSPKKDEKRKGARCSRHR